MGDHVAFEAALVVEVEVFEALAGRQARGADAVLAAVVLAGGDLALETGGQELLVAPVLCAGPVGQTLDRRRQRWRLERPTQVRDVAGGLGPRNHHATPVARS
jgi:hypothetical protein